MVVGEVGDSNANRVQTVVTTNNTPGFLKELEEDMRMLPALCCLPSRLYIFLVVYCVFSCVLLDMAIEPTAQTLL